MSTEAKKDAALHLFLEAWKEREEEQHSLKEQEAFTLNLEISKLTKELENINKNINELVIENAQLKSRYNSAASENKKLEQFKANLLNSIQDQEDRPSLDFTPSVPQSPLLNFSSLTPRDRLIDGKRFFAESKSRLSYENFSKLLSYVKQFNDKFVGREQLLSEVSTIFGRENRDLYENFSALLSRTSE
ncbi:unnamed protein product [Blepharisma stoltei]|uniref:At4g15545-like C-terminal domain-containing protein n=1 Tax=Blepharisma stoltei TaxID=1481888 RepID=A0AAU9IBA2_9CILI|nr:unnamed protein product [Blepharisma stoltei]